MKILLINHFPLSGSGSGVYTENIAYSLEKIGHKVCAIFPDNQKIKPYSFQTHPVYFKNHETIENQLPFNFPCFTTHPRSNKTFNDLTVEELKKYKLAFSKAIEEEIKNFNPDVIHCGHIWLLSDIASKYNIPLIITAHGTDLIGYQESDNFKDEAINAAKKAQHIITISKENKNKVQQIFPFAADKIITIPNGYNPDIFYHTNLNKKETLKEFGVTKEYKNVISFAGKFTYFKGIDVLLKAAKIYDNDSTITLLSGDGQLFDEMKQLAKQLNIKNIKFLGNQSHENLRKIYNIADVSIVPSRSEAFGLVVIEAMACGAPVIGTYEGGIKDIITEETGIFINKEDYKHLAQNVNKIIQNQIKFDRDYISSYTKENYSNEKFVKILEKTYIKSLN